jgi:hypothetical protein
MNTTAERNGTVYDTLLQTVEENEAKLKSLNKEIDRLISENLRHSEKYNGIRLQLSTSNMHLFLFLDEMEARFDKTSEFDSPEICRNYLDAANYCEKYFDRRNNRINDAKHWYDNYSLPFKRNEGSENIPGNV